MTPETIPMRLTGPKSTEVDGPVVAVSRRSSGEERKIAVAAGVDEVFCLQLEFGGGFGDPFGREPEKVLADVREGYVTDAAP
jgi:N-methylhydantoinase B/oxoprolinase/acetone carboxylase alpha subunit